MIDAGRLHLKAVPEPRSLFDVLDIYHAPAFSTAHQSQPIRPLSYQWLGAGEPADFRVQRLPSHLQVSGYRFEDKSSCSVFREDGAIPVGRTA